MWIIGADHHPSVQQIAFVNIDTGECGERRMGHSDGEAEKFYRELKAAGCFSGFTYSHTVSHDEANFGISPEGVDCSWIADDSHVTCQFGGCE